MFGISFGRKKTHAVAVAFAGSATAGCAVVGFDGTTTRVLSCSYSAVLPITSTPTARAVIAVVKEVCDSAAKNYASSASFGTYGPVKKTYGIAHAPWAVSKSNRADSSFAHETVVTEAVINELAQRAMLEGKSDLQLFESSVVKVELNGYSVGTPKGKKAHAVSVAVLASTCDEEVKQGLISALQASFPCVPVLRSDVRVLLEVASDEARALKDCVVLHVTSEATLCVVMRKGVPTDIETVGVGTRSLVRAVGETEDTLSLLRLVTKDMCSNDACRTVEEALAKTEPELARLYGEGFTRLTKIRRMPDAVVLVVHPDFVPWFSSFFARLDFAPFTVTLRPFQVHAPQAFTTTSPLIWNAGVKEEMALLESIMFVNTQEGTAAR